MKKLSGVTKKLTGMAKLRGMKIGAVITAALAVGVFAAAPAAQAQRFGIAVQLGGPAYYTPAPVAVYGNGYGYGYGAPAYGYYGGDDGAYAQGYRWGDSDGWRDRGGWGGDDRRGWGGDDRRGWGGDDRGGWGRGGDRGGREHR